MKVISHDSPQAIREQSLKELQALQKSIKMPETLELIDCFDNAQNDVYVLTKIPKRSMADYVKL